MTAEPAPDVGRLSDLELRAWRGLIETSGRLRHRLDQLLLVDSGLSGSDYPILVTLHEADTPTLRSSELATRIGWERSRLSHQLARMERRGLLRRTPHPHDSRGWEVGLTEAGRATYLTATTAHSRAVRDNFVVALDSDQLRQLGDIMDAIDRHLRPETSSPDPSRVGDRAGSPVPGGEPPGPDPRHRQTGLQPTGSRPPSAVVNEGEV